MAGTAVQLISGTAEQTATYTGAAGSLSYESDTNILKLHNGQQAGGFVVPTLVAVQRPTAANDYTWYRKYSDGWVEQGGRPDVRGATPIYLPIKMRDSNYSIVTQIIPTSNAGIQCSSSAYLPTTDSFGLRGVDGGGNNLPANWRTAWYVCGYAA